MTVIPNALASRIEAMTHDARKHSATHRAIDRAAASIIQASSVKAAALGFPDLYSERALSTPLAAAVFVGVKMDQSVALLGAVTGEVRRAKEELEDLKNQTFAIANVVLPAMLEHVTRLRETRMAVVDEMRTSLVALRDVRQFFLDKDYAVEMERLERFVRVCKELQALKAQGTLDAVCDSALRLATGEPT